MSDRTEWEALKARIPVGARVRYIGSAPPEYTNDLHAGELGTVQAHYEHIYDDGGPESGPHLSALTAFVVRWDNETSERTAERKKARAYEEASWEPGESRPPAVEVDCDVMGPDEVELVSTLHDGDCVAYQEREELTRRILAAAIVAPSPTEELGSERALLNAVSILQGIVNEYRDGGDQMVENCTCEAEERAADLAEYSHRMATRIDMAEVARLVEAKGLKASVQQTGGGCATLYVGEPTEGDDGELHYAAVAGPGRFDGPRWTQPTADLADFYVGPDDDGDDFDAVIALGKIVADTDTPEVVAADLLVRQARGLDLPAEGTRVVLTETVERYPHFTIPAGARGTIVQADAETISIRLDDHVEGAEEWDNELIWSRDDDPYLEGTPVGALWLTARRLDENEEGSA